MIREVEDLGHDIRKFALDFAEQASSVLAETAIDAIDKVYLTGSGDSYFAARAAEMAFESIGNIPCEALNAQRFMDYESAQVGVAERTLVVTISASGETKRSVQAALRARDAGAVTIAIAGKPDSSLVDASGRGIVVDVGEAKKSPGIRTFQASLLATLVVAIRLGETRDNYSAEEARSLEQEVLTVADVIESTADTVNEPCRKLAAALADAPTMMMVGGGPNYGTALFGAAKIVEAAGVPAIAEEMDEWWHVARLAYPVDMPIFVIAPPGRSHWRAKNVVEIMRTLGKRAIVVAHLDDAEVLGQAHVRLPVQGHTREEFSPLAYHVFSNYVAAYLAESLDRLPFQSDRTDLVELAARCRPMLE